VTRKWRWTGRDLEVAVDGRSHVLCALHLLQGCNSQEVAVTRQEMTSRDWRWPEVNRKWRHLTRTDLEVAAESRKLLFWVRFSSYRALTCGRWQSHDRKRCHMTGSDPEVTWLEQCDLEVVAEGRKLAFWKHFNSYNAVTRRRWQSCDRKSRHFRAEVTWKCLRRAKTRVLIRFSSYRNVTRRWVTWQEMTCKCNSSEVMSFQRKWPGSGCKRPKTHIFSVFQFLQGCTSQEVAVTCYEMTSRHLTWLEVIRKWRHLTGSDLEVTRKCCRRPKTRVLGAFQLLQGCSSLEVAVTWHEMTSRDLPWAEVTRKWRHLTVSYLEFAVEGRRRVFQPPHVCDWQEVEVTWQEMTWRDLTWTKWPGT